MLDYIYDMENYPNIFTMQIKLAGSENYMVFEISERKNDLLKLVNFVLWLKSINARLIGFNNLGYDNPILCHIMKYYTQGLTYHHIYEKGQSIIDTPWDDRFRNIVWPNDWVVEQIDLYKIHHFDNRAKSASLKYLEFQMHSHNISDLPFPPCTVLTHEEMDVLISYGVDDILETEKFYFETLPLIKFREELTAKYGISFMNASDKKIGADFFTMRLEEAVPGSCYEYQGRKKIKRQTHHKQMDLGEAVFPYVQFEHPEFNRILNFFKSQIVTETNGVFKDLSCTIDGFKYVFGSGGIHGCIDPAIVTSDDEYDIVDIDVRSYYPRLGFVNKLYPAHIGVGFYVVSDELYEQRVLHEKGTSENGMFKLGLNGAFGDTNSIYSVLFDSMYTMKITINGQLLLCMLAEQMHKIPDLKMIQINTDGFTVKVKKKDRGLISELCRWWESFTCLELEEVEYNRMFIRDVNNYIAEGVDGKLKHKGTYHVDHPRDRKPLGWHQDTSALVVAKAAEAALVRNEDIRTFITTYPNLWDFMLVAKVARSGKLLLVDDDRSELQIQNTSRYHVSQVGGQLVKILNTTIKERKEAPDILTKRTRIQAGFKVTVCNNIDDANPAMINYEWYINEARKVVDELKKGSV